MANFEELARAAREKSQGIVDAEERAKRARLEAEANRLEKAERALHDHVVPVLTEAQQAFAVDGIDMVIEENETFRIEHGGQGKTTRVRIVTFQCTSKLENHPSGMKLISGDKYVIENDGSAMFARKHGAPIGGNAFPGGSIPDFVAPIVAQALESYYVNKRFRG